MQVTDPVYCGGLVPPAAAPCANYTTSDCSGITIVRLPNAVIDGFVPAFNPLDPLNRTLTANFPVGTGVSATTIQYNVTDGSGNTTTITITVNVTEFTIPSAACKPVTVALGPTGTATIDPSALDNGSTDNCGSVNFTASQTTFGCAQVGLNVPVILAVKALPVTLLLAQLRSAWWITFHHRLFARFRLALTLTQAFVLRPV